MRDLLLRRKGKGGVMRGVWVTSQGKAFQHTDELRTSQGFSFQSQGHVRTTPPFPFQATRVIFKTRRFPFQNGIPLSQVKKKLSGRR